MCATTHSLGLSCSPVACAVCQALVGSTIVCVVEVEGACLAAPHGLSAACAGLTVGHVPDGRATGLLVFPAVAALGGGAPVLGHVTPGLCARWGQALARGHEGLAVHPSPPAGRPSGRRGNPAPDCSGQGSLAAIFAVG